MAALNQNALLADVHASYDRLTANEDIGVGVVLGAYRSFRGDRRRHVAYVGMPITTGRLLYQVLARESVHTPAELEAKLGKGALYELVIKPNVAEGIALADRLGSERAMLFIAPSVFEAKPLRWSEHAYMTLWYRVIGELAGAHYVSDGWEYSLGGVKEVFFSNLMRWGIIRPYTMKDAMETFGLRNYHPGLSTKEAYAEYQAMRRIQICNASGETLRIDTALNLCTEAILQLKAQGFPYQELLNVVWKLRLLPVLSLGQWGDYVGDADFLTPTYHQACKKLEALVPPAAE